MQPSPGPIQLARDAPRVRHSDVLRNAGDVRQWVAGRPRKAAGGPAPYAAGRARRCLWFDDDHLDYDVKAREGAKPVIRPSAPGPRVDNSGDWVRPGSGTKLRGGLRRLQDVGSAGSTMKIFTKPHLTTSIVVANSQRDWLNRLTTGRHRSARYMRQSPS